MDIQGEIRRAMERIRVAHEILARLTVTQDDSVKELLRGRAESLGTRPKPSWRSCPALSGGSHSNRSRRNGS